jgi:YVTN family beta-propeller protein
VVQFRILGPLQVLDGDADVPLGSPKERALLGVLLLHAGAVVSRERLIDALWGESPPPTAAKALNVHVSQLRKTLVRNGHEPIRTRAPGYAIDVEAGELDATRFERHAADARTRVAVGDVASASRLFGAALALWRGPALDGVELESQARHEAARLDDLRLGAQMDRIDCELALGSHDQLIPELEALVDEHPLRERLRGQLILALYRAGRQADALQCYRDTRESLVGELGIEPSPALQRLEKAILNQDRSLAAPTGIAAGEVSHPHPVRRPLRAKVGRRWVVLVAAAVVVVGGTIAGVALSGSSTKSLTVPPNAVGVIDPHHNRVIATIAVGRRPGPVAYSDGSVWISNLGDTTLTRIDAGTRRVVGTTPLGGSNLIALTAAYGVAWSADPVQAMVKRVAGSGVRTIPIFNCRPEVGFTSSRAGSCRSSQTTPCWTHIALAVGANRIWATCGPNLGRATLTAINPTTGRQSTTEYVAASDPIAIAYSGNALWVANFDTNAVSELNPLDRTLEGSATVAPGPVAIAALAGSIWVVSSEAGEVSRIRFAANGAPVVTRIGVGGRPVAIAAGNGAVWVADAGDRTVSRIDPATSRVTATIPIGGVPAGLAVGDGVVWISSQSAS